MRGLVIRNTGSWYVVRTDDGQLVDSKIKGNFRLKGIRSTNPVAVGDFVQITVNAEGTAFITEIEDRKNYIIRKASNLSKQSHIIAANVDQAFLIVTVSHPETSTTFIDRFLASAEAYRVPVSLVFNKTDCYDADDLRYMEGMMHLYTTIGYPCHACSALQSIGIDALRDSLKGQTTLLSGHSGVGKSTLLNTLIPDLNVRTAEISAAHDTGMHTTTFSEMFSLPGGGYVIDTPGFASFDTQELDLELKEHLPETFPEFAPYVGGCRFVGCSHTKEKGCAVLEAVHQGKIPRSRHASYLRLYNELKDLKAWDKK